MRATNEIIFIFVILQLTWFAYIHMHIGSRVDTLERTLREIEKTRYDDDEKTQKYGFLLRKISTLERTVYKFDFDLERISKEINTLAKLSSSQDKNGVDRREITKIKKRLDALQNILNHIPDLVEKVEDENMDSFTKLKEELDSLRMSVQQQKNGGGIIIERDTSGDRPSDMPQKPRSSIIVGDEATT